MQCVSMRVTWIDKIKLICARNSASGENKKTRSRRKNYCEMIGRRLKQRKQMRRKKHNGNGPTKIKGKWKTKQKVCGCGERQYQGDRIDKG